MVECKILLFYLIKLFFLEIAIKITYGFVTQITLILSTKQSTSNSS